jgi:tripartite-type tricarboxylate transporter receptor subunit TctC
VRRIDREAWRRACRAAAALGALAMLCVAAPAAQAQGFPVKPVRLVVPFTPGGSTDILARSLAQALTETWKQQVIVENKPGAGGIIGAEAVARAAPDGYTLLMGHIGTLAVNPTLYPKLPYNAIADFAPVALVAMVPNVLVVHPSIPARTVSELIALAKAKPGVLTYSTGGTGSAAHLATEYFKLATGTDIVHVPYKGAAPAVTDVIGGQVSMTMTGLPPLLQHVRASKLRALGVASTTHLPQIPEVPTIAESGVTGFEATQWYGVVAPARTPPAIVDRIAADVRKALDRLDLKQRLEAEGAQPTSLGPAEFGAFIRKEIERWAKVIRAANIQPN